MIAALIRSGLVLLAVGMCFVVARAAVDTIDVSPVTAPEFGAASVEIEPPAARVAVPPLADLAETRERPLFSPERRSAAAPAVEAETMGPQDYALIGLMRPAGSDARALIRTAGAATATWVLAGGKISGYVVREIKPGAVVLERGGRTLELPIRSTRTAPE
jgi:hypothetical protein